MSHSPKILPARKPATAAKPAPSRFVRRDQSGDISAPGFARTDIFSPGIGHRALAEMKASSRITRASRHITAMGVVPRDDVLDSMGRPQGPLR